MFPDEKAAVEWFEQLVWNGHRCCGHCGSLETRPVPNQKPMPLLVPGLPILLQRSYGDRTGTLQGAAAQVGLRHLLGNH